MDDMISRRAAIDVLSQYPFEKVVNCISIIEELPSAQPTQNNTSNALKSLDCIDRQAAIEAMNRHLDTIRVVNNNTMEMIRRSEVMDCREIINGLPSAEVRTEMSSANDTISRQAAIDVLHGYFDGMLETDTVCPADIYGLFECIPSAEPDPDKIHLQREQAYMQGWEDARLIDRQAAIDSVCEVCENCEYFKNEKLIQTIKDLPSAQPEIIRCKDCRWREGSECVRFADVRPFPDDYCSRAERREDE